MSQSTHIKLNTPPSTLSLYRRALFSKGLKGSSPKLPSTKITLANVQADSDRVKKYSEVCGFKQERNTLPLTFPHMLAFPLHLELMLLKNFPFPVMGMVHVRNEITQHRAIKTFETMDVICHFSGMRKTDKGFDVDIKTDVYITGELVWESISTNLVRRKTDIAPPPKSNEPATLPTYPSKEEWQLPANLGRRYAAISGDSNPIHLFAFSAKLFGFKGHIAHGMWTKARTIAALYDQLDSDACKIVIDFKLPVFLPAKIQLNYEQTTSEQQKSEIVFDVRDQAGTKPHMKGTFTAL